MVSSRPERKPFSRRQRVSGDPGCGAFYGWRIEAAPRRHRKIEIVLPGRSPTGNVWAAEPTPAGLRWTVPRQWHRGRRVRIDLRPAVCILAAGPTPAPGTRPIDHATGETADSRPSIVVVAGQHPGESPAIRLAQALVRLSPGWPEGAGRLRIVTIANSSGWRLGHTRETADGRDPNRSWHLCAPISGDAVLRAALATADFVLDMHGDEFADAAYLVGPAPSPPAVADTVARFASGLRARTTRLGRRPRPPGDGEDHPGILINWLASAGVPGMMLELPMRLPPTLWQGGAGPVVRAETAFARALLGTLAELALSMKDHRR